MISKREDGDSGNAETNRHWSPLSVEPEFEAQPDLIDKAVTELALGDNPDTIEASARHAFWRLQSELNQMCATSEDFETACKNLELDPNNPIDGDATLFYWQVIAINWLHTMERSKLHGALLADDTGLGKTIMVLKHISLITRKFQQSPTAE